MIKLPPFLHQITRSNTGFVMFFALSAYALQFGVTRSIDILWDAHNHKRSWAYLEQNIPKWKDAEDEDDE